jgi:hypothetical protein
MTEAVLNMSARTWFVVTALGQWIFTGHVADLYGPPAVLEGPDGLAKLDNLFNGWGGHGDLSS